MRAALIYSICLLFCAPATVLAADPLPPPRPVRLDYQRGPGAERCPEQQAFRDHAGAYAQTSGDLFAPNVAARLVVTLGRRAYGYEGTLVLYDAAGAVFWSTIFPPSSRAPAASCADLVDSLALSATYQIDPIASLPLQPSPLPVVSLVAVLPQPAPLPRPVERSPFSFRFGAAARVDLATALRPAAGLSFGLGFRVSWFSLELEAHWDPPAGADLDGVDLTTTRFVGALVPCGHVGYFIGCALAEVGPLWGTVTGAEVTTGTQRTVYVATGGRVGVEFPFTSHLALRPTVDLLLAVQRTVFRIENQRRWETPTVAASFGLGLIASF